MITEPCGSETMLETSDARVLSVLIADIEHSSILTRRLGPQRMVAFLEAFYDAMISTVGSTGQAKQCTGDQVLVLFGDPFAAIRCARRMQVAFKNLCKRWGIPLSICSSLGIGVATGLIAGGGPRYAHALAGVPVILAARLSVLAKGEGGILIDESTNRSLNGRLVAERQAKPRRVKGFESPVQLYRVGPPRPRPSPMAKVLSVVPSHA